MVLCKVGVFLFSVPIRNKKNEEKPPPVQLNSPGVLRGEPLEGSFLVAT